MNTPCNSDSSQEVLPSGRAEPSPIIILLPNLGGGGAERLHVHLANDWARRGHQVEIAVMEKRGELVDLLRSDVKVVDLGVSRFRSLLWPLARYLKKAQPAVVLAAMWPLTSAAVCSWMLARCPGRLFLSDHCHLSIAAAEELGVPRWRLSSAIRLTYARATGVIAVSNGVRDDLCALGRLSPDQVQVIYNPTAVGRPLVRASDAERAALWGAAGGRHILSVGTLKKVKDHATLVRAFALLPPEMNLRMTILGEGPLRRELEQLVRELRLEDRVRLPGFVLDPYPWYLSADVFALSSRWEGFGNVIVEALECGLPVVSTDCPSGPAEILEGGRYGKLVPMQDPIALAAGLLASLSSSHDTALLRERAKDFSVPKISDEYLRCLGMLN